MRKDIPGFPNYQIEEDGSVWSSMPAFGRNPVKVKKLIPWHHSAGYHSVSLRKGGKTHVRFVHRLVLLAFIGPCPPGHEVCHNDGDKTNNRLSNLRYDTRKSNHGDKRRHGTHREGTQLKVSKLTEELVYQARVERKAGSSIKQLMEKYGMAETPMYLAVIGKTWKHVPTP